MADVIYNSYKKALLDASINHGSDTIKLALVTATYTPDQDAHDFFNDITNELSGGGYTSGGATLASKTTSQDNTDNEGVFSAATVTFSALTGTARGAVLYKSTGVSSTSPLMAYFDFGSDKTSSGGDFIVTWNAEGIVNVN